MGQQGQIIQMLKDYQFIIGRINELQKEIDELWEMRNELENRGLQAVKLTDMPKRKRLSDPVYQLIEEIFDIYIAEIERISGEIMQLKIQKKQIEEIVNKLLFPENKIISLRYFDGFNFRQIGKQIKLRKEAVIKYHNQAIQKLETSIIKSSNP